MKCLSLHQPFATLIILGAKRWETRSWRTHHRGRLAIHASRKFPEQARSLCRTEPFRSVLLAAGYSQSADLPRGLLLGTVDVLDCLPADVAAAELADDSPELAFGDFGPGRWAWQLANPAPLPQWVAVAGRLGLFDIQDISSYLQ